MNPNSRRIEKDARGPGWWIARACFLVVGAVLGVVSIAQLVMSDPTCLNNACGDFSHTFWEVFGPEAVAAGVAILIGIALVVGRRSRRPTFERLVDRSREIKSRTARSDSSASAQPA